MIRRALLAFALLLALSFTVSAQTPLFPNPTSACQRCANSGNVAAECAQASAGLPGKYCFPFLNGGIKQACCCPTAAICGPQSATQSTCTCDNPALNKPTSGTVVVVKKSTPVWVWIVIALGVILLIVLIWWFCCRGGDVVESPVYYEPAPVVYQQPGAYGQPGVVYQQGYGGGDVAAGVVAGAAVGMIGGVALGAAIGGGGHHTDVYVNNGGGYGGDGFGEAQGDFAGDF